MTSDLIVWLQWPIFDEILWPHGRPERILLFLSFYEEITDNIGVYRDHGLPSFLAWLIKRSVNSIRLVLSLSFLTGDEKILRIYFFGSEGILDNRYDFIVDTAAVFGGILFDQLI